MSNTYPTCIIRIGVLYEHACHANMVEYGYLKIAYLTNTCITLMQGYYILYTQTLLLWDEHLQFIVNIFYKVVKSEVKIKHITDIALGTLAGLGPSPKSVVAHTFSPRSNSKCSNSYIGVHSRSYSLWKTPEKTAIVVGMNTFAIKSLKLL